MHSDDESILADARFFAEWRREQTTTIREFRQETIEAIGRLDQRLSGMEARLNETQYAIERHSLQIAEMNSNIVEVEGRVMGLEKREVQDAMTRIRMLESSQERRETRDAIEQEQTKRGESSLARAVMTTVVCTAAGSFVTGAMGLLWWLVVGWVKSTSGHTP